MTQNAKSYGGLDHLEFSNALPFRCNSLHEFGQERGFAYQALQLGERYERSSGPSRKFGETQKPVTGKVCLTNFSQILRIAGTEAINTLRRPSRLMKLCSPDAIKKWLRFNRIVLKSNNQWVEGHECAEGIQRRLVESYKDYVELQGMKLDYLDLANHESRFRAALRERLSDLEFVERGKNALCLGARLGAEVRAFIDLGLFAVGVDLNPGQGNSYVLHGDFQHLQVADDSVDVIYTNSIDHAFDLEGMISEILRIVKSNGYIIFEPDPGFEEAGGIEPDFWATLSWKTIDDLTDTLEGFGLRLVKRRPFEYPRGGQQLIFVPSQKHSD